jgi:hypothetical protein
MDYDKIALFRAMCAASRVEDIGMAAPASGFMKYWANPGLNARKMAELLDCVRDFMATAGLPNAITMDDLTAYFQTMERNRAFGEEGATAGNGTIWLFLMARALNPELIIESGVYYGSSNFMLRQAAPKAKMIAFDISFRFLVARLENVEYREHDWASDDVRAQSPNDLCFFDDHINNCMRIRQSYDRGFRHVVVDDSPDIGELHDFRCPAVPSIAMVENGGWADGDTVEWNWHGRRLRYTFRTADTFGAKEVIEAAYRFPSLKRWTGMDDALHYYVRVKAPT